MKKVFAILLSLTLVLSLAACGEPEETKASGSQKPEQSSPSESKDSQPSQSEEPPSSTSAETCVLCYDLEAPADRKCDTCGNWVYPQGEAWTQQVPENVKVTMEDNSFFYVVEKIGEGFYIQMWSSQASFENNEAPYEDYMTLDTAYTRNPGETEWKEASFKTTYADVYNLFAVKALGALTGSGVSQTVEDCLELEAVGTETIAGKECTIKEYESLFGTQYRVWFWENLPIKEEYQDTSMDSFEILYQVLEWDDTITEFSTQVPA